jgi:hypothetical protein
MGVVQHGGTPNVTLDEVRAIPSATYCAPWFAPEMATGYRPQSLPRSVYNTLSARGRVVARLLACDGEALEENKWVPDWDVNARQGGGGANNSRHRGQVVSRL